MVAGAGGADHGRTPQLRQLDGDTADTTGRRMDEHPVSCTYLGGVDELLGGQPDQRERAGADEVHSVRHLGHGADGRGNELGKGPVLHVVLAVVRRHPVAGSHLGHGWSDRDHLTGDVPAGNQRQVMRERALQVAGHDLPVHRVDPGGGDLDQDVVGAHQRVVDLRGLDDVGVSIGANHSSSHVGANTTAAAIFR
ncbi:MAG: hypothetical protein WAK18_04495 [Nocardioidaceae bacterium]